MGCIANMVFGFLQFAAFLLILVGTPLDQFRARKSTDSPSSASTYISNDMCITIWGYKDKCYSTSYTYTPKEIWSNCDGRVARFKTAAGCVIATIVIAGASCLAGFIQNCYCGCLKYLCIILNIACVAVVAVTWGCLLDCYLKDMGSSLNAAGVDVCQKLKDFKGVDGTLTEGMRLGTGFILVLVGWALCIVNIFIILIPL